MLEFKYASSASQGARAYQEDACAVWPGTGSLVPAGNTRPPDGTSLVAVLADGMGGHAGGAIASVTICGMFLQHFVGATGSGPARLSPSLTAANDAIRAKVRASASLAGMGATLVGAVIGAAGLSWISVGDSPMYLFRNGELAQLNEDHSLAPVIDKLLEQGKITAEEARADPRRHYLRSAVSGEEIEMIDAPERPVQLVGGDIVVISSDGIHTLEPDDIRRVIASYKGDGAAAIADALVRNVDNAGAVHQDNTTVIVITVAETG